MDGIPRRFGIGVALVLGAALGYGASAMTTAPLRAGSSDRSDERAVATGPITLETTSTNTTVPLEAIYYLNYSRGRLLATVPTYEFRGNRESMRTDFAERDLVADFQLGPGARPHFLMTTAEMGRAGQGWAPLFVFETESGQVATYRVTLQSSGTSRRPVFKLLDRRADPKLAPGSPDGSGPGAR